MKNAVSKLLIGASIAAGVSAMASAPAHAGSMTNVTIGGTAQSDYLIYDANSQNTFLVPNTQANVQKVLGGNATNPTGNVELRASSEKSGFDFKKNTTLSGKIGGKDIMFSSLTDTDWFGAALNKKYGANTFATKWFNQFLTAAGKSSYVGTQLGAFAFDQFLGIKGFERSSDPNISYVNQDDNSGLISIGLAGHYDLKAYYASQKEYAFLASQVKNGFQASEVVKYTYNGLTDYLYSFSATKTGLTEKSDGKSHSGNYEVTIKGVAPKATPEPSVMLGMLGVAGIFAAQRKRKKA